MLIVYADQHYQQSPKLELAGGELVASFENPQRAEHVLSRLKQIGMLDFVLPEDFGLAVIEQIHCSHYIQFLQNAWEKWEAAGLKGEIIPLIWPAREHSGFVEGRIPQHILGQVGYYALGTDTNITMGTWKAAYHGAQAALTGADAIAKGQSQAAFVLARPPGHHAAHALYGGYCFLNNAGIAAQHLRNSGFSKVAILDVDYHHGNGTQDIFYQRNDVFFISIHGEPQNSFPYFWGYEDECGEAEGEGFNQNIPLPHGTGFSRWEKALQQSLERFAQWGADALVISLGVDTFEDDPISTFRLQTHDYITMGKDIAGLKCPTLFVMEGGYNIEALGINMVNVLQGFEGR